MCYCSICIELFEIQIEMLEIPIDQESQYQHSVGVVFHNELEQGCRFVNVRIMRTK